MLTHKKAGQKDCKEQCIKGIKKSNNIFFPQHIRRNFVRDIVGLRDYCAVIVVLMNDKVICTGQGTLIAYTQLWALDELLSLKKRSGSFYSCGLFSENVRSVLSS